VAASQKDDLPTLTRKGTARPGNVLPVDAIERRRAAAARRRIEGGEAGTFGAGASYNDADDDAAVVRTPPVSSARQRRNAKHNDGFTAVRGQHKLEYLQHQPGVAALHEAEREQLQLFWGEAIERAVQAHPCRAHAAHAGRAVVVSVIEAVVVQLVTPLAQLSVQWPTSMCCSECKLVERGPLSPLALGLFAANPTGSGVILFDQRVLKMTSAQTMSSCVSFQGAPCVQACRATF
jgi:hypothetical protein